MADPIVSNVKIHFKLPRSQRLHMPPLSSPCQLRRYSNFFTFRQSPFVFCVFDQNRNTDTHVNVSGLRHFGAVDTALRAFDRLFGTHAAGVVQCIVDNSTASGRLSALNLHHLCRVEARPFTVSIRPHFFSAAVLRGIGENRVRSQRGPRASKRLQQLRPATAILFPNGKYIIVGARSVAHLRATHQQLQRCVTAATDIGGAASSHESVGAVPSPGP